MKKRKNRAILFMLLMGLSVRVFSYEVSIQHPILPVLTMKSATPLMKVVVVKETADKQAKEFKLDLKLSLKGTTDISDIRSLSVYGADDKQLMDFNKPILEKVNSVGNNSLICNVEAKTDTTVIWVAASLKNEVNLNNRYKISCTSAKVNDRKVKMVQDNIPFLRPGVALRQKMQDKVNTSRIPGIATSKKGTLMAIYDARYDSSRDLQGNIDIAMNRSFDGGKTWQPMQIVLDMHQWGNLPEKYNGVSDACILVDENSNDIYVAGLWMHGVLDGKTGKWVEGLTNDSTRWIHQWHAKGSQPGLGVKETCQFLITKSSDDGATWSKPINITSSTKRPQWWLFAPAPGHGITLKDGTLVLPTQGRDKDGIPFSNITWSKDGGKTWTTSNPAYSNTTECMAVELSDGSIMLNMRDNRNRGQKVGNGRRICVTKNLGETWVEHPTSRNALVEPTCMASIHKHYYYEKGVKKSIILFVNPNSYNRRDHISLQISYDDGRSWTKKILIDEFGGMGYSCITSVDENTIGVLYESSQALLAYQQFSLAELLK